jgi:hypothetical protein
MLNVNIISNVIQHINLRFQVFQATKRIMLKLLFKDFFHHHHVGKKDQVDQKGALI